MTLMYWDNGHMSVGWAIVMMAGMMAFWVILALATARLLRRPMVTAPMATAEQILAERLARGEIELEDYQARLTALT